MKTFEDIWAEVRKEANAVEKPYKDGEFGMCGFAWITIPGRGNFAKWAKEKLGAHKNYTGPGFNIWYSEVYDCKYSQNIDNHEVACEAGARVLNKYGIKAFVSSRLD